MGYNSLIILMTIIFSTVTMFICISLFIKKKYKMLPETIAIYILYIIFLLIQYKLNFQVRPIIIMLVLITCIGNSLIGKYLNVYNTSKYYDRFLHAFGAFSFSLFYYSILDNVIEHTIYPKAYISIFVASIGISLCCIFEIYEFIIDSITTSYNQPGLKDTNFDLISDVIGSVLAGIISIWIF